MRQIEEPQVCAVSAKGLRPAFGLGLVQKFLGRRHAVAQQNRAGSSLVQGDVASDLMTALGHDREVV